METDRTLSTPGRRARGWVAHRLLVVRTPDPQALGRVIALAPKGLAIGRVGHVDGPLALVDAELSRVHARVTHEAATDTFWIEDPTSRNGTFVNGRRERRAGLVDQDVVRLGATILVYERAELEADAMLEPAPSPPLLGRSLAMARVRGEVAEIAPRAMSVLVLGETGTGKELVARALHERSGRRGALVAINCGGLPPELVESELFGHTAGAFTGAAKAKDGLFVAAEGGTLFLDEIGEMPAAVQPTLLRALATGEVRPVGASAARHVDVRVVAATHQDLAADVESGRFRGDLFARLAGWTLAIPPLRSRREDVLELAATFLARQGAPARLEADAAEALVLHRWPFNVRELEQACAAIAVRAAGHDEVALDHLPRALAEPVAQRRPPAPTSAPPLALRVRADGTPTAEELREVLAHHGGNVARVASFFGRDRRQVYRWIERYGLDVETHRE